jgi:hypothetical protein
MTVSTYSNDLSFEFKAGGGPPIGNYNAEFVGVKKVTHEEYGPGLCWEFKVIGGPHDGTIAARTTTTSPTALNACGKMIQQLTGGTFTAGQKGSVADCVGKRFLIVVAAGKNGTSTRVETVVSVAG